MNYYKFLDLPEIPDSLVSNINPSSPGALFRDYKGWEHTKSGQKIMATDNPFYHASQELKEWLGENIIREFNDVGVRFAFGGNGKSTAGVHTDATRKFVMQYNLVHADGVLTFWQEKGQPIVRNGRYTVSDYDALVKLDEVFIPNNRWMILDAMVLHSVENLTGTRINVQISLNENPFQD
jgi:hypothetical protein